MMSEKRESVGSRIGFLMMAAGCAIGLGNVWRFPFVTGKYGGAFFVLVYLLCLLLIGFPMMVMELAVGRAARRGLYGAFANLPEKKPSLWRIPAGIAFTGNLILMMMYTTISGWMFAYMCAYASGQMNGLSTTQQTGEFFKQFLASPGRMSFYMMICVILASIVCAIGLRKGVERVTKILMAGLFVLLVGLSIYALTLPGAKEGMEFYLRPDCGRFTEKGIWEPLMGALEQSFFTLSLGIGSIAIFGSYVNKERSLTQESLFIILLDTTVALLSGVLIFSACFSYGVQPDSGPGLVLISMTNIFNRMICGQILGFLFFLFLTIAAMTTVIAVFENLIALMIDEWHLSRKTASLINMIAVGILSFPCVLGFNVLSGVQPLGKDTGILDLEDWIVSGCLLPLGSVMIIFFCTWKCGWGWKNFITEANTGKGLPFPRWAKYWIMIAVPVIVLTLFSLKIWEQFFK